MENDQIVSRMNTYLHTSAKLLEEWLGKLLPKTSDDWWEECVISRYGAGNGFGATYQYLQNTVFGFEVI